MGYRLLLAALVGTGSAIGFLIVDEMMRRSENADSAEEPARA